MARSDDPATPATPTTEAHTLTLRITREFHAPRELVWQGWTQREHLANWFCPKDFTVLSAECDLRVGGAWRSAMQSPEGKRYIHHGVYRELAAPERLVFTHAWEENDNEEPCQTDFESLITVTLSEHHGRTEMVFEQVGFTSVESRDSHEGGWTEAFDNLAAFVHAGTQAAESLAPTSSSEIVITRVFDAPRELVWKAWTEPEHIARWWGPPGFTTRVAQHDLSVGGGLRYVMTGPDGKQYPINGQFREIEPMQRLSCTMEFDETCIQDADETLPGRLLVTLLFEQPGQGTRMTARIMTAGEDDRRKHEAMGIIQGWGVTWDQFAAHLIEMDADAAAGERNATDSDAGRGLSVLVGVNSEMQMLRTFAAPREKVFNAHTDPDILKQWCTGPDGFEMPVCEEDPRPGGSFRWEWRGPGGMAMTMTGTYREVDPPKRLVRHETFEMGCDAQAGTQLVTAEFIDESDATLLMMTLEYSSVEARDATLASGMEHGMAASYDRLARWLDTAAGAK